jgi:hypothetical protein
MHTVFCYRNLKERDHLEDRGLDRRIIILKLVLKQGWVWTGLIWLRIGANGDL